MTRHKVTRQITTARRLLTKPHAYRGLYTRVARDLGVTVSHVRQVALGVRGSRRVESAVLREIERIESEQAA